MIYRDIKLLKDRWLYSNECSIKELINYIKRRGKLRDAQIEAIEVYLFLKIKGENRPLWQLFSEGFFIDISKLNDYENFLYQKNIEKLSLYLFAKENLPTLAKKIEDDRDNSINYQEIIKKIFYNIDYSDYLLSLPMGAGKTYLMASFIYLDLSFLRLFLSCWT